MTGVHAASFWVGGTVPGYAWGEGKGERAAVRSKKFKRGRFRDSVYQYRRMFLCPSIFPLLLQGGVLGRVDFDNTGIGRCLYAETLLGRWTRCTTRAWQFGCAWPECGSGSVKSEFYI